MSTMQKNSEQVENKVEVNKKPSNKWKDFYYSFIWLAIILLIIDIITKVIAYNNLTYGESIAIPGLTWLVQFTLVFNTGAAWGFGGDNLVTQILLCILSYAAAIGIIYFYIKKRESLSTFIKVIMMICLAGDVGNLIDRTFALMPNIPTIYSKGVIDFIDITPLIPGFGIFNFADSCLSVGIIILIVYEIVTTFISDNKKDSIKK